MLKEAWEDYQRHKHDKVENFMVSRRLVIHRNGLHGSHEEVSQTKRGGSVNQDDLATGWQELLWKDIRVGDIILIQEGESVPADVIVLFSSHQNGSCYIETSNLDGESNLKQKLALPASQALINGQNSFTSISYEIEAESPTGNLNQFEGSIHLKALSKGMHTLTINHLLPRGTTVVNTNFVFCAVIYTGEETKIRKNASKSLSNKAPTLEALTNWIVIYITILSVVWEKSQLPAGIGTDQRHWYLNFKTDVVSTFFSFMILYNNMIPISLYVLMELVKLTQAFHINCDLQMYDPLSDTAAQARTSNLHEDLGQVQYVFTDKTGTLTQNIMLFRKMSVGGLSYAQGTGSNDAPANAAAASTQRALRSVRALTEDLPTEALIRTLAGRSSLLVWENTSQKIQYEFLLAIALCHTVEPHRKHHVISKPGHKFVGSTHPSVMGGHGVTAEDMAIEYQSSSPDEVALLNAAREMSFVLRGRTMTTLTLNALGSPKDATFEILQTIEFSSKRKRMSVIYRYPDGRIMLLCKGADSVILERLKDQTQMSQFEIDSLEKTMEHLAEFATEGLRTLLYAFKELSQEEYDEWSREWQLASLAIKDRTDLMEDVAKKIEQDLTLLGATAIEDKLQVGVPDTIERLRRAGIKVWMLTGDKRETAINIAYTCNIAKESSEIFLIDGSDVTAIEASVVDALAKIRKDINDAEMAYHPRLTSAVEGLHDRRTGIASLGVAPPLSLESKKSQRAKPAYRVVVIEGDCLAKLEVDDRAVQAANELNKAASTKSTLDRFLDLATICDGVICCRFSPSQKALIVSKVRARTASDFGYNPRQQSGAKSSFPSWLKGRFLTEFPSGVTLAIGDGANDIPMLQSAHVGVGITGWSATSFYEQWTLTLYNILFSSLPVIVVGVFEKDLNKSTLLGVPELYAYGQYNYGLNLSTFFAWMAQALWHSLVSVFLPFLLYGGLCTFDVAVNLQNECLRQSMVSCFCSDLTTADQESFIFSIGNLTYTIVILLVNLKVCYVEAHNWTIFTHISFAASEVVWWLFTAIYSRLPDIRIGNLGQIGLDTHRQFEKTQQKSNHQLVYWSAQFVAIILSFVLFDLVHKLTRWRYDDASSALLSSKSKGKVFAVNEDCPEQASHPPRKSFPQNEKEDNHIPDSFKEKTSKKKKGTHSVSAFTSATFAADQFCKSLFCGVPDTRSENSSGRRLHWARSVPMWQLWEQKHGVRPDQEVGKDILHILSGDARL
ncbi:hypothetical protein HDU96_009318 [Phlyctochytrium bullatum]|nr:hypothetical protein HDU96_009318 [Phlyctochytrium bullatum]